MMTGVRQRIAGLCLPPLLFAALDGGLTLAGQSAEYWTGALNDVNEGSPIFHHALAYHPLAFCGLMAAWAAVFVGVILLLPDTVALIASIAVTLGHASVRSRGCTFNFMSHTRWLIRSRCWRP